MKPAHDPMTLRDIEVLLMRASQVSNHRRFVVAGSLSILGAIVVAPSEMVMSRDLDFYPQLDPDRGFHEIASELGERSAFSAQHGYFADPISPAILALPAGWESRMAPISLQGGVVAFFIEPNDVAVGKLARSEEHDLRWVRSGIAAGVLQAETIRARARQTDRLSSQDLGNVEAALDRIAELLSRSTCDRF